MYNYLLTLIYSDSSKFIVGGFSSLDSLNKWVEEEKMKIYWDNSTITQIDRIQLQNQ